MNSEHAQKLLDIYIDNSSRIMNAGFGVNMAESSFFDVVRLLQEESSLKICFLERVRSTFAVRDAWRLDPGFVPIELIELVAHEFRWPELLPLASERIAKYFHGNATLAIGDIAHRLSEAYDDNWQGRTFYARYKD